MSRYCVACGAAQSGGIFCPECGSRAGAAMDQPTVAFDPVTPDYPPTPVSPTADPLPPADPFGETASSPQVPQRPPVARKRGGRGKALAAAAVVALCVGGLTTIAISSAADEADAERAAAEQLEKKQIRAKAEKIAEKRAEEIAEEKIAAEREQLQSAQANQPVNQAPPAPPPAAATSSASATGSWSGTMDDGHYSFEMQLYDDGDTIYGSIYQYDNTDGESGTQDLTGYREGDVLYLRGSNVRSKADGWVTDNFAFTLSPDGDSITGTYRCEVCSTNKDASGYRTA